jgi:hypothetical protein
MTRDLILGFAVAALALIGVFGAMCYLHGKRSTMLDLLELEREIQRSVANTVAAEREIQFLYMLQDIAFCESSLEHDAENGSAYGIFQFKRATFDWMSDILDMQGLNYNLPKHQWVLAEEAFRRGLGTHWECCTMSEDCLAYTNAVREGL